MSAFPVHAPGPRLALQYRGYCLFCRCQSTVVPILCVTTFLSIMASQVESNWEQHPPCTGGCQGACRRPRRLRPLFVLLFVVVRYDPAVLSVDFDLRDRRLASPVVQVGRDRLPKVSVGGCRGPKVTTDVPAFLDHSLVVESVVDSPLPWIRLVWWYLGAAVCRGATLYRWIGCASLGTHCVSMQGGTLSRAARRIRRCAGARVFYRPT